MESPRETPVAPSAPAVTVVTQGGAPEAFVRAIERRIGATRMRVVAWWADDLDGDHVDEAIAKVCNSSQGFFLVMRGKDLLEAPLEIDGRNHCPETSRPTWERRTAGTFSQHIGVHHGSMKYTYAVRDGAIALIASDSTGFYVDHNGERSEEAFSADYDQLTWKSLDDATGNKDGAIVLVGSKPHRATTVMGKTTMAAALSGNKVALRIHAEHQLQLRDCSDQDAPCKTTAVAAGDRDVLVEMAPELEVFDGTTSRLVRFEQLDGDASYPSPPKAW